MPFQQDLTGSVEPTGPDWDKATPAERASLYDYLGGIVLDRLRIQLSRGIGANGQQMKPRIRAVLPDGADGPVMEPHYDASRVITLSDYSSTDHSLKLWWHAGNGHASSRAARARGGSAVSFADILGYHAAGLVRHAPVRDVRLSKASLRQVRSAGQSEWDRRVRAERAKQRAQAPPEAAAADARPQPTKPTKPARRPLVAAPPKTTPPKTAPRPRPGA